MADHARPEPVAAVRRALRLLEAAGAHGDEATAEQLARDAGLPLVTVRELLPGLARDGYVRELDDGTFTLAGTGAGGDGQGLLNRVRPVLTALRNDLSAAVYLTLYVDGEIRIMEIVDSARTPRVDLWVGFEDAGHATALGKSVLRELDPEARADYLSRHSLTGLTPRTITHRQELIQELDTSSTAPLVMDREEYVRGTTCVAVPVYSGDQVGSLGISFRSDRMYRSSHVRQGLLSSAIRVSQGLSLPG
ncbi:MULTISPECIES: IclR family transcriptional regulator [unclassified Streptomyces]|uniref:IclR family transcriptional regulator n=1 Tax=unclassified Streptomyces TaxID=2593676 RepID=UPI00224DC5B9|nr:MULTISPECIES: IclR family transcriptional regulator C-terminal domain-containing protein [unclassified Streptomyces]MCX5138410.1 helix-turn-helix domain-containing protein [Streptomyces sp. NBC_00338]WRZ63100.1 helix-turn-helix domain-containing protein [Streptomyces sp. NBC_01257]WSU57067.1 helix-turn-helix domain-containing protein [Streptomyces sp. NBC_01104]